jgi:hypothetical protein
MRKKIGLFILLIGWNTMAFNAVGVKIIDSDTPTQKHFLDLSNEEIEDKYGLDLSWKEKIGLWLMRKKIKQQLKKEKKLEQLKAKCQEPSECYRILLRSGKIVYARDFRFEEDKLRYQWCNKAYRQSKIPLYKIAQIYNPNGGIVYTNENNEVPKEKVVEGFGVFSFLTMLLAALATLASPILGLILFGVSLTSALISILRLMSDLDKYRGGGYLLLTFILSIGFFFVLGSIIGAG